MDQIKSNNLTSTAAYPLPLFPTAPVPLVRSCGEKSTSTAQCAWDRRCHPAEKHGEREKG